MAAAIGAGLFAASAAAETHIVFGNYAPPTNVTNQRGYIPFLEAIEKQSDGAFTTSQALGGSIIKAKTSLFGLRDGLVDAAYIPTVYYPAELPVNNIFANLGSALDDVPAAVGAMSEVILLDCPECMDEMKRWNMRFLGAWSITAYDMMCRVPVRTAEDVKGLRIRGAGHIVALSEALGATPINVPTTEMYEVLQRGAVDCVMGPPNFLESYSLGDSVKYITDTNAGIIPSPTNLMLREDLWETLSPEQKRVLVDAAPIAAAGATFGYEEQGVAALNKDGASYELIEPDASLVEAIRQASAGDFERAVRIAEEKGVTNAREIATKFMAAYERWKGLVDGVDSEEAYAELLRTEVFSRYPLE